MVRMLGLLLLSDSRALHSDFKHGRRAMFIYSKYLLLSHPISATAKSEAFLIGLKLSNKWQSCLETEQQIVINSLVVVIFFKLSNNSKNNALW